MLGVGAWCSAGALLALREHFVYQYVVHRDLPMDGGASGGTLLALAAIGAGLAAAAVAAARRGGSPRRGRRALLWMASCAVIPLLAHWSHQLPDDGPGTAATLPTTFLEPLYFAFATTMAVWAMRPESDRYPQEATSPRQATPVAERCELEPSGVLAAVPDGAGDAIGRLVVLPRRTGLRRLSTWVSRFRRVCPPRGQHLARAGVPGPAAELAGVL